MASPEVLVISTFVVLGTKMSNPFREQFRYSLLMRNGVR